MSDRAVIEIIFVYKYNKIKSTGQTGCVYLSLYSQKPVLVDIVGVCRREYFSNCKYTTVSL